MANVNATNPDVSGKGENATLEKPATTPSPKTGKGNRGGNMPSKGDKSGRTAERRNASTPNKGDSKKRNQADKGSTPQVKRSHKDMATSGNKQGSSKASDSHPAPKGENKGRRYSPVDVPNSDLLVQKAPDLVSKSDLSAIFEHDNKAGLYEGKPDVVAVAINTWLAMARDTSLLLCKGIKAKLVSCGFGETIRSAKSLYSTIMVDGLASLHPSAYPWISELTTPEDEARMLAVLAFPKRFTYGLSDTTSKIRDINNSLPRSLDITDFRWHIRDNNRKSKAYIPHTIIWGEMHKILEDFDLHFKGLSYDDLTPCYSNPSGASHDICNCPLCKTLAMHNIAEHGYSRDYCMPSEDRAYSDSHFSYLPYENAITKEGYFRRNKPKHYVYPINVPKELGVSRVIAPEDIDKYQRANTILQYIYTWLWDFCPEIAFEDQTRAEINSYSGSKYGDSFTKDCSGASDRIPRALVKELLPNYYEFIESTLSTHMVLCDNDGNEIVDALWMLATSGHPLTYVTESVIYWAAMKWSQKTYDLWSYHPCDSTLELVVIGDDTSGPNEYSDLAELALNVVFAHVNKDKSYDGSHPFRESCGYDYWKGVRVPPVHWPRKDMKEILNFQAVYNPYSEEWESPIMSLVELVKQMNLYNFTGAANYVAYFLHSYGIVFAPYDPERTQNVAAHGAKGRYRLFGTPDLTGKPTSLYVAKVPAKEGDCMYATTFTPSYHTRKKKRICLCADLTDLELRLRYEDILYHRFLEHGPRYATPLLELLHVSEPELPYEKAAGQPAFQLKLVIVSR